MFRILSVIMLGAALSIFGVVNSSMAVGEQPSGNAASKPLIKCSTCGVEFTSSAGVEQHLKAHPDHEALPVKSEKPLIRCSTCGVEFTSSAEATDHVKVQPTHKTEVSKPLVKCSTCGVEFTSGALMEEHMKSHPHMTH